MNKKTIIVTISAILLVTVVLVSALSIYKSSVSLSKASKDQLTKMGLTNITKTDCIPISLDECQFKMYDGDYRLGTHTVQIRYCDTYNNSNPSENICLSYTDYTEKEIKDLIQKKSETWLEDFGAISIEREASANLNKSPKVLGGTVTVVQK